MRALQAQFFILMLLCLFGITIWIVDFGIDISGDWFGRFGVIKLIWAAIGIYAFVSSICVFSVWLICKLKKWPYTTKGVWLTHGIGIGLVYLGISLGIHDRIDDTLKSSKQLAPDNRIHLKHKLPTPRPTIPSPPISSPSKRLPQAPSNQSPEITAKKNQAK
jgi:hypothetical protein